MAFKGFDRLKNAAASLGDKKKPVKVIKEGDMSPETKALPDEVIKPPKGIGSSENDMGPLLKKKYKSGGSVSSASKRADGIAIRGKTRA